MVMVNYLITVLKKIRVSLCFFKYDITNDTLNSSKWNHKRVLAEISSEEIRSDKRIKGDNLNVLFGRLG